MLPLYFETLKKVTNMSLPVQHHKLPLSDEVVKELRAGDLVSLTGTVYTARDAAHQRLVDALDKGEALPIALAGTVIYYCGPTPAAEGHVDARQVHVDALAGLSLEEGRSLRASRAAERGAEE